MQPKQRSADAQTGFIHMFDRSLFHLFADMFREIVPLAGLALSHRGNRRGGEFEAEHILDEFRQTILRNKMPMLQIHHYSGNVGSILRASRYGIGKRAVRLRAAMRTSATMRPMFRHLNRLRFGYIKDLPLPVPRGLANPQGCATPGTGRWHMVNNCVGIFDLSQVRSRVSGLAAGFFTCLFAQIILPRFFAIAITGWWLAAVLAV